MSLIVEHLQYTKDHEWLKKEEDFFLVGVTDHAQDAMSDVVFVELSSCPLQVSQGDVVATVESVKTVSEIYAPISGEVFEINSALKSSPDLLNNSTYEDGWIFKIRASHFDEESSSLMDAKDYQKSIA